MEGLEELKDSIKTWLNNKLENPYFASVIAVWVIANRVAVFGLFNFEEHQTLQQRVSWVHQQLENKSEWIFSGFWGIICYSFIVGLFTMILFKYISVFGKGIYSYLGKGANSLNHMIKPDKWRPIQEVIDLNKERERIDIELTQKKAEIYKLKTESDIELSNTKIAQESVYKLDKENVALKENAKTYSPIIIENTELKEENNQLKKETDQLKKETDQLKKEIDQLKEKLGIKKEKIKIKTPNPSTVSIKNAIKEGQDSFKSIKEIQDSLKPIKEIQDSLKPFKDITDSLKPIKKIQDEFKNIKDAQEEFHSATGTSVSTILHPLEKQGDFEKIKRKNEIDEFLKSDYSKYFDAIYSTIASHTNLNPIIVPDYFRDYYIANDLIFLNGNLFALTDLGNEYYKEYLKTKRYPPDAAITSVTLNSPE